VVSTFAGTDSEGFADGTGTAAQFNHPLGVAVDSEGNIYVADYGNHRIRKITPAGVVSTFAGTGTEGFADGTGNTAQFNTPPGVAVDSSGNVYVADANNHLIRKITPAGVVSTLAGTGTEAQFNGPPGVAVDSSGNVYVADFRNHRIRKITPEGVVSTFVGTGTRGHADGTATTAQFEDPYDLAVDSFGNVYVTDSVNHLIRKITPAGVVSIFAGSTEGFADGTGTAAQFDFPFGVAVDSSGNVYVTDANNHLIRRITPAGVVSTLAGTGTEGFADGTGTEAQFDFPSGVAVDSSGNVYVADSGNHRIRKITPEGVVSTLAGSTEGFADGAGNTAQFEDPYDLAVDSFGNVYVADAHNHRIRKITPADRIEDRVVSTLAGSTEGFADGTGTEAQFNLPFGVAVDSSGNVFVADANNHFIRRITPAGVVSTFAGTGSAGHADGTATTAQFKKPYSVAVDSRGNVYVTDADNHLIRRITPAGMLSIFAGSTEGFADGTGNTAQFENPYDLAVDSFGNVYVTDAHNHRIRKITPAGVVSTLAGTGSEGHADGTGNTAQFYHPTGVAVDSFGNVYVVDSVNHLIRKIEYKVP